MDEHLAISKAAALLADPTRLEMLLVLMDGRAFPAGELAARAHVSNPTASHHLALLADAGFVEVFCQGRHRYHRLSNPRVAELIESMGAVAPVYKPNLTAALITGRSCYNHLAGQLGVHLRSSLESQGLIVEIGGSYQLTSVGSEFLQNLGFECPETDGKTCLDWSERLPHIGGALGRSLFRSMMERSWIRRGEVPRQVCLTVIGQEQFDATFPVHPKLREAARHG